MFVREIIKIFLFTNVQQFLYTLQLTYQYLFLNYSGKFTECKIRWEQVNKYCISAMLLLVSYILLVCFWNTNYSFSCVELVTVISFVFIQANCFAIFANAILRRTRRY